MQTATDQECLQDTRTPSTDVRPVTVQCRAEPESHVFIAGTFNGWNPLTHKLSNGNGMDVYETTLHLPPGRYEYKFLINGTWCADPECTEWVRNHVGSLNSVIRVE